MRALFDVNVLIALLDSDHICHSVATSWFSDNLEQGWASCPITENATARVMSSPGYPNPLPVAQVLERIAHAAAGGDHRFWPDDLSLTDPALFRREEFLSAKHVTDRYLLALAVKNKGRLVTFDETIRSTLTDRASPEHVVHLPSSQLERS